MFSENRMSIPTGPSSIKECKRDLEGEAKHLHHKLEVFTNLCSAVSALLNSSFSYQIIDSHDDRNFFLSLVGGLHLAIPIIQVEYESILKEMEKEASK